MDTKAIRVFSYEDYLANKNKALDFVFKRVNFYNQTYNFSYNKINIKNQKNPLGQLFKEKKISI